MSVVTVTSLNFEK